MAQAQHTPGPWWIAGKGTVRFGDPHSTNTGWIGSVNWRNQEANARLIAAAPDLLASLDARIGDLELLRVAIQEGDPKAELLLRVDDMLRWTRAAIAKAEPRHA